MATLFVLGFALVLLAGLGAIRAALHTSWTHSEATAPVGSDNVYRT